MIDKRLLISLGVLIVLFSVWNVLESKNLLVTVVHPAKKIPLHEVLFFDQTSFYSAVTDIGQTNNPLAYHLSGGIVPHHLYPSFIIADFFHRLSLQKPTTIIFLGPNHFEQGKFKVLTSMYGWHTPKLGVVEPRPDIIQALVDKGVVQIDENVLPHDHAIAGILPFVKYYLPDTRIVPLLLSSFMNEREIEILAKNLSEYIDEDTVLVASVDFSHYLTSDQAKQKDAVTEEVVKSFNYKRLLLLNSDYLDSPPSIATLLKVMQMKKTIQMDILYHTNAGELSGKPNAATTSYYSIVFHE